MAELPNSFHRYSSWGRTRSPKNIINSDHTTPVSVTLLGTDGAPDKESAEYVTENQRFLHLQHIRTGACTIQVQAYLHASGQWADFGSAITVNAGRTHTVLEIFGVDKIKFVVKGLADTKTCTIFAACSTF